MIGDQHCTWQILSDLATVQRIVPQWAALCDRSPKATPFQRPEWLFPWLQTYPPEEMFFVTVRQAQRLVGVAPLLIYRKDGQRTLAFIGGGVSDYLDAIVDPSHEVQTVRNLIVAMNSIMSCENLELTDLPATSPLLGHWPDDERQIALHDSAQVLALRGNRLSAAIPPGKYKSVRNARSRLRRMGDYTIEIANQDSLPEVLSSLFDLHQRRWNESGSAGVLEDPSLQNFHRLAASHLLEQGLLRLYCLQLSNKVIASLHTLFYRQTAYLYIHGFDPAFSFESPGTILFAAAIEDAIARGMQEIDFLRGREPYKTNWGARERPTYRLSVSRHPAEQKIERRAA